LINLVAAYHGTMFSRFKARVNPTDFKARVLSYINNFPVAALLDSNSEAFPPVPVTGISYDFIAASGVYNGFEYLGNSFKDAAEFVEKQQQNKNWIIGYLSYDLKNQLENLKSEKADSMHYPLVHFFVPQTIFIAKDNEMEIIATSKDAEEVWNYIVNIEIIGNSPAGIYEIENEVSKNSYANSFNRILSHIHRGDIYEMNFCNEILVSCKNVDVLSVYSKLVEASPNPFACFYKNVSHYLLCASPERFLRKEKGRLISQPMKGTAARGQTPDEDEHLKNELSQNVKERSENVMIVDLVRNDLSRIAAKASVKVDELFGVYTFQKVHQMISTVSCEIPAGVTFAEIITATFPMGSMTGAPKISAMKIIEENENFKRGLFSGTVGYIDPTGDFDFNVVIRSIRYNAMKNKIALAAGGAITAESDMEKEYAEMMLKFGPQLEALFGKQEMENQVKKHAE
jgi:para-aminobenzoate synthetase component I